MPTAVRMRASAARRLFMAAQGLCDDPARDASAAGLLSLIERLGFVQMDTINVLARAHDLTLFTRLDSYRPTTLAVLLEQRRSLFEHWTHDASAIPTRWYSCWKPRFRRDATRLRDHAWWSYHLGRRGAQVVDEVRARVTAEGPLRSADFEHPRRHAAWWGWKPQKAALDYLWRSGELAIRGRVNFHKIYDLTERVLPEPHRRPEPDAEACREWACASAAERLGVFTARELAGFWNAIPLAEARAWCALSVKSERLVPVLVEGADGSPRAALALSDWRERLRALPEPPDRIRLLSPFDPVLRDRARALRRFGYDYRFEAFTPRPKRRYGYYVLPLLEGDRLVGRLDAKLDRQSAALLIQGLWWEPGVAASRPRRAALDEALARLARWLEATEVKMPIACGTARAPRRRSARSPR
jgi:uncharacterized protein YcaQ